MICLVRGQKPEERLERSFEQKQLTLANAHKIETLTSDISEPYLDLESEAYKSLASTVTHIVHCAWPVNFQLGLQSFLPSLKGLHNLIQLSLLSPDYTMPRLVFCSSISVALGSPSSALIPESRIESLEHTSNTGYVTSKLVGERIIEAASQAHGLNATILRLGQVVGDTGIGIWNDSEAFPLIIRSAVTMEMLPEMKITERWLPVDTAAETVVTLAGLRSDGESREINLCDRHNADLRFYNVLSPHSFSWNRDLLPALHKTKLTPFEDVPSPTWIARLRGFSTKSYTKDKSTSHAASDPNKNPAVKLVDFLSSHFSINRESWDVEFDTQEAEKMVPALRNTPKIIESGLLGRMVDVWMSKNGRKRRVAQHYFVTGHHFYFT